MSHKINCICVDDELPALRLLEAYCAKVPEIKLLGTFSDSIQALEFIENNEVDLAIMDIQMPKLNGIDFYKSLPEKVVGIFISANPSFAVEAFEIDILDFILKPASLPRFEKAIGKVLEFLNLKEDFLVVKQDYLSEKVKISDILFIEGSGEYLKINTIKKNYLQLQRIKDFEVENAKFGFIRIHKSYLVLKSQIQSANSTQVILKNGKTLPVGRVFKNALKVE